MISFCSVNELCIIELELERTADPHTIKFCELLESYVLVQLI